MIQVTNLSKKFQGRFALKNINIKINREKVAVLGPNGAGKSTLAKLIAGVLRPTTGKIEVMGHDPYEAPFIRRRIGLVTHNPLLYKELTVKENLEFFLRIYQIKKDHTKIVEELGISNVLNERVSNLSRGYIQRVSIARALISDPEIIIMDEIMNSLDLEGKKIAMNLIRRFDGCLIFITHNLEESKFCDKFVVLEGGELKYYGNSFHEAFETLNVP